jgi:hypothetical protein
MKWNFISHFKGKVQIKSVKQITEDDIWPYKANTKKLNGSNQ